MSPDNILSTHVNDVCGLIETQGLNGFILVGHEATVRRHAYAYATRGAPIPSMQGIG